MKIFPAAGKCIACPQPSDVEGDHAIACGYAGERIARHDQLRNALYHTCSQACLAPTREERALIPGTDARPADLLLPSWTAGRDTALDVTVVSPLQVAMVRQAAQTPGHALVKRAEDKMLKHGEACRQAGIVFVPLVFETVGGWGEQTVAQVKKMGSALARQTGGEEGEVIRHLVQRVSVLLTRGNAALLLNRMPSSTHPAVNGVN